ncbi:putative RING-H2 finger protein ATL21A [Salvia splendens]|uniref:putative RING-H2 finger protein ATL21A n=1 Tax=Salvia splendens TaxID=180675 RepID=UPI001C25340F|nr:putative RING-H2 finger protein ATL21A [Salvia splendens]XP_042026186.1 putative RING-H2 finger protein ATL21A [Salvia splendens]
MLGILNSSLERNIVVGAGTTTFKDPIMSTTRLMWLLLGFSTSNISMMNQLLEQQQPQNCGGYPGFSLTCSDDIAGRGALLLTLPYSGNFSVRYINYLMQEIQLYDPDGCLPLKLMALNLTSSPFEAMYMDEFVFLSCPRAAVAGTGLATVDCLGNSTSAVVATTSGTLAGSMSMCTTMFTLPIPVSWDDSGGRGGSGDWLSSDLGGDLRLTWSFPDCKGCEARGGVCGYDRNSTVGGITCYFDHGKGKKGLEVFKIIALSIVIPAIMCSICISCFTCIVERRAARNRAATVAPPPPQPPAMVGLDESTIESYKKVVLGESKRLPGPNGVTCPICLVDYCPKDELRCIPECQHCFHSECVDEWLRLNSSCPLCRNSPSHPLEAV